MEHISTKRRALTIAGMWLGAAVMVASIIQAGLLLVSLLAAAAMGAGFGAPEIIVVVAVLGVGALMGSCLLLGGRMVLRGDSPAQRNRGTALQVVPATLLAVGVAVALVVEVVVPNVGSGRYTRDYTYDYVLARTIERQLNEEYEPQGIHITIVGIEEAEWIDPSVTAMMDQLCTARGLPPASAAGLDSRECSLVNVTFERAGGSYRAWLPVHNLADRIRSKDDYAQVATSRVRSLVALDASYWEAEPDFDPADATVYYWLRDDSSSPLLVP